MCKMSRMGVVGGFVQAYSTMYTLLINNEAQCTYMIDHFKLTSSGHNHTYTVSWHNQYIFSSVWCMKHLLISWVITVFHVYIWTETSRTVYPTAEKKGTREW